MLRTALTLTAATAGLAVAAAPAGAWTAVNTGTFERLTMTAAPGEVNNPSVAQIDPVLVRITDPNGTPVGSSTCTASPENHFLQCKFAERVVFDLGDKNDVNLTGDAVTGGLQLLDIKGGTGNDRISNQKQAGTLDGGPGTDVIRPGLGADVITGGTGLDAVDYSERTKPVRINFFAVDDSTEQGEQGEGDSFSGDDVEVAFGGKAGDVLIGNGNDEQFVPGPGTDTVEMRQGTDVADLRDGEKDTITCGTGDDTVYTDLQDVVNADCENVSRTSTTPPLSGGEQPGPPTFEAFPVNPNPPAPGDGSDGGSGGGTPGGGSSPAGTPGQPGTPGAGPADVVRPKLSLAHVTRKAIRRRAGVTNLRFTVSEPAALAVKVEKLVAGRRSGGRCVKATEKLRRRGAKACTRAVKVTTLQRAKVEGVTSIRLTTRINRSTLGAGRYRLTLVATDAARNASVAVKVGLRVTRR